MDRKRLPNRRLHQCFTLEHWGQSYVVGVGCAKANSEISEVFINTTQTGSQAETLARDSAVLLSIALQFGAPLAVLRDAVTRNPDGKPSGPIGAILDAITGAHHDGEIAME